MKHSVPPSRHVLLENVLDALRLVGVFFRGRTAIRVTYPVVVARDEHLFDTPSVGMFVVGEYGIPRIGYGHKVFIHALVRHVASDDDRIYILAPEPFERMFEREVVSPAGHLLARHTQGIG